MSLNLYVQIATVYDEINLSDIPTDDTSTKWVTLVSLNEDAKVISGDTPTCLKSARTYLGRHVARVKPHV